MPETKFCYQGTSSHFYDNLKLTAFFTPGFFFQKFGSVKSKFVIASCVVWGLEVINIFESLVVLNIENHTVELTGLPYSQEFDNIFSLCCRGQRCPAMTQNSVIVYEINTGLFQWGKFNWDEWPHIKYFGTLIILLKLIDVSLLLHNLNVFGKEAIS